MEMSKKNLYEQILFAVIIVIAFTLRIWGINFGLPELYHADEPIIVNHALAYAGGDLNPHFFRVPPLISYLLFIFYGLLYVAGHLGGIFSNPQDFEALFFSNPSLFYGAGRFLFGAAAGTLSIAVFYRLLKRNFSLFHAQLGAFAFAVCFLHVRDSHYLYCDIPLLLVLLLGFQALWNSDPPKKSQVWKHLIVGGWIGLSTAVKYNGFFLIMPYALFSYLTAQNKKDLFVQWLSAGSAALLTFILLNPYSVLNWNFFYSELMAESRVRAGGVPWTFYLFSSLPNGVGTPILIMAVAGLIRAFFIRDSKRISAAFFLAGYFLILIRMGQPYDRYVLPLLPWILFFSADFFAALVSGQLRLKQWASALLWIAVLFPNLISDRALLSLLEKPDTRLLAKEWILKNIPAHSSIALEGVFMMPRLNFAKEQLVEKQRQVLQSPHFFSFSRLRKLNFLLTAATQAPSYFLYFLVSRQSAQTQHPLFATPIIPFSVEDLQDLRIQYVVLSDENLTEENASFMNEVKKKGKLIASFNPYKKPGGAAILLPRDPTALPITRGELTARTNTGPFLQIYEI